MLTPFDTDGNFRSAIAPDGLRRAAIRGAGVTLLGQGTSFFLQIASTMVLARLLTPNDFGIVTMVTTFSLLFRSFGLNGFTELIMQREDLTHSLASNLFWIDLGIGTVLTLAFASAGSLLALFYHNPAVAQVTEAMSLTIGIGCFGWIHLGLLQRAMHFRTTAIINFIALLFYVILTVALAMAGWHYWALVWGSVTQVIVTAGCACLVCRWIPSWPRPIQGTRSGFKFAMSVYAHFAFSYSTRNTDNLLIGWRFGARALGLYKKAYDLFVLPETQLLSPISAVVVSTLSRVNRDPEQFRRYFLRAISVLALMGMGVGVDFALVGKDLIRLLLGPGWEQAGRIFALFGPGIGVMLLYNTHGWIHLSIGRPERWFRWGLLEFLCTVTLFLVALPWGPSGIAFAWTASYFLLMFPGFWYAGRPIGLGIGPVLAAVWKFFAASAVAGVATVMIIRTMPYFANAFGGPSAFVRMVSVSLIFFALYLGGIVAFYKGFRPLNETTALIRDLLPERLLGCRSSRPADINNPTNTPVWIKDTKLQPDFAAVSDDSGKL